MGDPVSDPAISATPSSSAPAGGSAGGASAGRVPATTVARSLSEGDSGPAVRALQRKVGSEPDGIFGPRTETAVERYQRAHRLHVDGVVGSQTAAALAGRPHRNAHPAPAHAKPLSDGRPGHAPPSPSRKSHPHVSLASGALANASGVRGAPVRPSGPHATPAHATPANATPAPASPAHGNPPAGRGTATGEGRYDGWSDASRGANVNLGDTESALHLYDEAHRTSRDGRPRRARKTRATSTRCS